MPPWPAVDRPPLPDPESYDRWCLRYPAAFFRQIERYAALGPGSRVLEVYSLTGRHTLPLLQMGCRVEAVEPRAAFARYLRNRLVRYRDCTVHELPPNQLRLPDGSLDLVLSADAAHCLPLLPQLFPLLRDGGTLALLGSHTTVFWGEVRLGTCRQAHRHPGFLDWLPAAYGNPALPLFFEWAGRYQLEAPAIDSHRQQRTCSPVEYIHLLRIQPGHLRLPPLTRMKLEANLLRELPAGGPIRLCDTLELCLARKPAAPPANP